MLKGIWIKWQPPFPPKVKLNVDGSMKGEFCSGGGVVCISTGNVVQEFSHFYGKGSLLFAEAQAILDGLIICQELGVEELIFESDSKLVLDMILNKATVAWEIHYIISCIRQLLKDSWGGQHVYREANGVADELAKLAHDHKEKKRYSAGEFLI
ncbi:PREDICTED: uncharacterized protein LOC105962639 [Erythranthe guttata]|uniref:uncharacterized protein LOC105962639 n=1 Tax=Erythranthe guttata TaxID=4155 RepID=UPI00064DE8A9|nr:PREDICTED: uncharacterized protein LOC105962639 [Erythranthe guttata]|eukprot:XP_012842406.1 PREDICTED: uncharacterized protein LOC105962639 [Erythranthe guttata]